MKRVIIGLSGGVDSSVAAYLLQQKGYEVIALFMKNWHDTSVTISDECPWIEDSNDALLVAKKLNIPFNTIDLSTEYKARIVDYMFAEYQAGRTPNPDILCNREIKFDIFLKHALALGADFVATGHYCRKASEIIDGKKVYKLLAGKDHNKDQSYFLCQLNQEQLSKALFPIGELTKPEVRKIAKELDLITAEKKDSQGLCFIGKVKLPDFLQQQLEPKKGQVLLVEDSKLETIPSYNYTSCTNEELVSLSKKIDFSKIETKNIGTHNGAHYYTIGQRKGIGIGGFKQALFVVGTDTNKNIVYLAEGENSNALNRPALFIKNEDIHWIRADKKLSLDGTLQIKARIRYRQALEDAYLYQKKEGLYVVFKNLQKGITPGQFCAWYDEDELLGSGIID
ncbi:MAG: tRNA 2-thiouridine(34) synthase MnmA [Chitinophagales bacterium]